MTSIDTQEQPELSPTQRKEAVTHLRGRLLIVVQIVWIGLVLLTVAVMVAGFTPTQALFSELCSTMVASATQASVESGIAMCTSYSISLSLFLFGFCLFVGLLVAWRKPNDWMALLVALYLVLLGAFYSGVPAQLTGSGPVWWLPLHLSRFLLTFFTLLFIYLFPSGRFVPRWAGWIVLIGSVPEILAELTPSSSVINPDNWSWFNPLLFIGLSIFGVGTQIYRYRRLSNRVEKQQTKWIVYGIALSTVGILTTFLFEGLLKLDTHPNLSAYLILNSIFYLSLLLIPLSIGFAVIRYHLWDIDPLINRTLVYATLTASVIGMYVLIVGYLGNLFGTSSNLIISLAATGLVAVLFQPLRHWLQRGVNRMMYGKRDDPYTVLSELGQKLETTLTVDALLPNVVQTIQESLKLPYVAITLLKVDSGTFSSIAEAGTRVTEPLAFPLKDKNETVGQLLLCPRAPGETFSPGELRLFTDLTSQIGIAIQAVRLSSELKHANQRLITAQEEERRRIRRDLHDGLGASLAGFTLQAGNLRKIIRLDPELAEAQALQLQAGLRASIADIRRLVFNLRPPALDELGLVETIRSRAAQWYRSSLSETSSSFTTQSPQALQVVVDAPEDLPPLPAAVEVAALRIVEEALNNVAAHAQAHSCSVKMTLLDNGLSLVIQDDGIGIPRGYQPGVGTRSMRERTIELGGSWSIEPNPAGGTSVRAWLPLGNDIEVQ